jgi:type II secretory pathway pseudopilin PulG
LRTQGLSITATDVAAIINTYRAQQQAASQQRAREERAAVVRRASQQRQQGSAKSRDNGSTPAARSNATTTPRPFVPNAVTYELSSTLSLDEPRRRRRVKQAGWHPARNFPAATNPPGNAESMALPCNACGMIPRPDGVCRCT